MKLNLPALAISVLALFVGILGILAWFVGAPAVSAQADTKCSPLETKPRNVPIGFFQVVQVCVCSTPSPSLGIPLTGQCNWTEVGRTPLPPTRTPTPTPTPTATTTSQPTATATVPTAPSKVAAITDFEKAGSWKRGNEPYGTFVQTQEQHRGGTYAQKLSYDFPAGIPNNYVVFRQPIPISITPEALRVQVFGDGSQHFLNAWLQDAKGQLWQFSFGRVNHTGWQFMEARIDPQAGWPNGPVGSVATAAPVAPLRFYAFVLDGYTSDRAFQGAIYLDDLQAVSFQAAAAAQGAKAVPPAAQSSQTSAARAGLVSDFENWGTWKRGAEPWGTFAQSGEQRVSGKYAGKLAYNFPADPKNYVVFRRTLPIKGQPAALRLQVYGDGSSHFLNAWVQDANGQLWQFGFGRINHTGWQAMTAPLDLSLGWPNQAVGAAKTAAPVYPLRFYAFVLDGYADDQASGGVIYLDDLEAVGP
jgi:hypothetical protein